MNMPYRNPSQWWSALIIDQMIKSGFRDFFCCPGMRNAPFLYAITQNSDATIHEGFDERAQSYHALGFMKATQKPAVLLCTSGTAVANFLPAIIEAEKTHLPLVVVSADRPSELNAADANQTINQIEVLRNYTKGFWNTSEPQETYPPSALAGKISFLLGQALQDPTGPVHINVPLREPLDHAPVDMKEDWVNEIKRIMRLEGPSLGIPQTTKRVANEDIEKLFEDIKNSQRPLLVFGPLSGTQDYDKKKVKAFINEYKGSFSCDITSGLKYTFGSNEGLIPTLDHPEVLNQLEKSSPDLVVHFGHRLTSKHYYGFLKKLQQKDDSIPMIHIGDGAFHEDPGFSFSRRWNLNPDQVISKLTKLFQGRPNEVGQLVNWEDLISSKRSIIEDGPLSYPFVTKRAVDTLTNVKKAFIGNSTFIRSFDSYAGITSPDSDWDILANRGASGIEGHLAMSFGMAMNTQAPTAAFIGDISFLHDLNSLLYFKAKEIPFLGVVVNNQGGRIFNLLPISKDVEAQSYFHLLSTPHNHDLEKMIKSFDIPVKKVTTREAYQEELDHWNKAPHLLFLEVCFDDQDNQEIYQKLKTVKL